MDYQIEDIEQAIERAETRITACKNSIVRIRDNHHQLKNLPKDPDHEKVQELIDELVSELQNVSESLASATNWINTGGHAIQMLIDNILSSIRSVQELGSQEGVNFNPREHTHDT